MVPVPEQEYTRTCPSCGKCLSYRYVNNRDVAEKMGTFCTACAALRRPPVTAQRRENSRLARLGKKASVTTREKQSNSLKGREVSAETRQLQSKVQKKRFKDSPNPMKGRSFYDIWLVKFGEEEADKRMEIYREEKSLQFENWIAKHGIVEALRRKEQHRRRTSEHNAKPMTGRSVYSVWLEKFGSEVADRLMKEFQDKQRKNFSGSNNPMFGKPAPQGSGNGWSGWYQGHYFRSLLELSYLLDIEKRGLHWETGEQKKFAVLYQLNGQVRTYFPDFHLTSSDVFIEVKPKRLLHTLENLAKFDAAKLAFSNFQVVTDEDITRIDEDGLRGLCASGKVQLLDKWQRRL